MRSPFAELPPRGRWVLLGCMVCQMGLGCAYVFGVTLKHIVADFEWSRAAYAAGNLPLLAAMALAAPLVGTLSERLGARRVLTAATLLLGLSLGLFSRMQSLGEFYLTSLLLGVALTGVGDIAVGAVAARWVARGRGLALGFVYIGSNIGGSLVPLLAAAVVALASWREALAALGLAVVVIILPFAAFVVREPPADYEPAADALDPGVESDAPALDLAAALRTRTFWILAGVLFSFYFYYLGVNQHLIAFLSDSGFSDARAAASFSLAVALGIGSKLGIGVLADRVPRKRALLLNFAVLAAGSLALLGVGRPGCLAFFLVAHGFATAAENVLLPLIVAESFGVRHMASIYGALMLALLPGGALGPIFAGRIFDRLGSYDLAFATFAALNLAALAALAWVRRERGPGAPMPASPAGG